MIKNELLFFYSSEMIVDLNIEVLKLNSYNTSLTFLTSNKFLKINGEVRKHKIGLEAKIQFRIDHR